MIKPASAISAAILGLSFAVAAPTWAEDKPYTVSADGKKVDQTTWVGMKIYQRGRCEACHGIDAKGGPAFPNLIEGLKKIDREQFGNIVKNGRNTMPPMIEAVMGVKMIAKYDITTEDQAIDALYGYVKGMSDGAFGHKVGKMKK